MTSSWLIRILYVAILTGSVERVRTDSAISSSSSASQKQSETSSDSDVIASKPISAPDSSDDEELTDADNSAAVPDKRKWGEKTMLTWGKRSSNPAVAAPSSRRLCTEERMPSTSRDRRRWGEKSMSAWGKRPAGDFAVGAGCEDDADIGSAPVGRVDRRKWGEKTMQVWGKRPSSAAVAEENDKISDEESEETSGIADKRKWGEKSMSAWGKRLSAAEEKRKWGSKSMTVWGKRELLKQLMPAHLHEQQLPDSWSHTVHRRGSDFDVDSVDGEDDGTEFREQILASTRSTSPGNSGSLTGRLRGLHRRPGSAYWGPKRKWETNTMKVWGKRAPAESDWRGVRTVEHE